MNNEPPKRSEHTLDYNIGEHAFKAGWEAARQFVDVKFVAMDHISDDENYFEADNAWGRYYPPEHLTGGGDR